jgi:hypothetical protein
MYHDNGYGDILSSASPATHLVPGAEYIGVGRIAVVDSACQAPWPVYTFIDVVTLSRRKGNDAPRTRTTHVSPRLYACH